MQITWLASYPKSGNTWVRFLFYHYFYGEMPETVDLNRRIPDIHNKGDFERARDAEPRLLVKTHWMLGPRMPHARETARAVYIVRNPRDVLLSCLNYQRLLGALPPGFTDHQYAQVFIAAGGDPSMARFGFGTWEDNVFSWTAQRRFPVLVVRYRDLKDDAALQLRRMLDFMGEEIDDQRLRRAADLSTFDRLRSLEAREKESAGGPKLFVGGKQEMERGLMFMNKGRVGNSLASIGPTLDQLFDRRFGGAMWSMGFGPPSTGRSISA